jgi:hydrogenase expression/formation protein HypD
MGSCMVSPEGSCAAYYLYGRWRDVPKGATNLVDTHHTHE